MNIKILDSWLKEYVTTKASPQEIAEKLSLTSASVDRLEKYKTDWLYDIEITTNRPDLMSVVGLARETATILNANGIKASFTPPKLSQPRISKNEATIKIKNDPKLVNRICAVVMDVKVKPTPKHIVDRLDATGMRSLNNLIDVTNYVTRTIGHSTHVFDFDRLHTKELIIREARRGEKIVTLDNKSHILQGGDIVADDERGKIVDLLGVMGLENSVVTNETKRILFFLDNNDPTRMRKTSMTLGIRSEAVILNEKGTDPELAWESFLYGIKLFEEIADGKVVSELIDIYPNKIKAKPITVSEEQINAVIGLQVPLKKATAILENLGFTVKVNGTKLTATPPSFRASDMEIPEDIIEEIARVYGYHNIPGTLPPITNNEYVHIEKNELYWEDRIKDALKYWGFTEVYSYPMISKDLLTSKPEDAVTIHNPLNEEFVYMRQTLIPSLVEVADTNPDHEVIKIFEIANIYEKNKDDLPLQHMRLSGLIRKPKVSFFEVKGVVEQLLDDLGIYEISSKGLPGDRIGAVVSINKDTLGVIEILDDKTIDFELDMEVLLRHVKQKRVYVPPSKYPPVFEDLALIAPSEVPTGDIIALITFQSPLIKNVTLLDKFKDTRTFHVTYQSFEKNLTTEDIKPIREKILIALKNKLQARLKS